MTFSGSDLTIVVPIWKRTTNLPRLYASIAATVPDAEVLLVRNRDDAESEWAGLPDYTPGDVDVAVLDVEWPGGTTGDYARKINAGYETSTREAIFTGADDVEFTVGWYEAARSLLTPDAGADATGWIGVVGTVDDCNERTRTGALSTHSLVARWYADLGGAYGEPRTIYHAGYPHEYVDDELCEVARHRGAYAHAFDSIVRHHHPNAGRAALDATYDHGRSRTRESRALFYQRRRLWSPSNAQPGVTTVSRPR